MKTLFTLLCSYLWFAASAQDIIIEMDLSDLSTPKTDESIQQSGLGSNGSCKMIIHKLTAGTDIDNFEFFIAGVQKDKKNDLSGTFNSVTSDYTLDFTTAVKSMLNDSKIEIKETKAPKKTVYETDVIVTNAPPPKKENCDSGEFQLTAQTQFPTMLKDYYPKIEDTGTLYIDDKNTVHLFIDHFGNYYGYAPPTTATEKYTYKIHLITSTCLAKEYYYGLDYTGVYEPKFNIDKGSAKAQSDNGVQLVFFDFPTIGPFTTKFTYEVKLQEKKTGKRQTIVKGEVNVPKLYHVSIATGMLATTLRNPKNIETRSLDGYNTLVADDPSTRGLLTIMAIYYPAGRSFLRPPSGGILSAERFGVVVGTQLGDELDENFLLGITNDFARGGAFTAGVHFGRRTYIPGYEDFKYGEEKYDLTDIVTKKSWGLGFFFGVVIDTRVAFELLKSIGNP